jgi:hypothetical protein
METAITDATAEMSKPATTELRLPNLLRITIK